MALTKQQQAAVNIRDKNLLVAAAAGSGKTKVLVERIKNMIIDDGFDVDKLLVVTFTNAAAQEMRSRIHAALTEKMRTENDLNKLKRIEEQIIRMSGASIMTMHAFCQMLLKRNFSKIDLDPKFRVADEQELNLIKQDLIVELFENKYADGGEEFKRFTDDFGGTEKGDDKLHRMILKLYAFAQSKPYPEEWLKSLPALFDIPEGAELKDTVWYETAMKYICSVLDTAYEECKNNLCLSYESEIYVKTIESDLYNLILPLQRVFKKRDWDKLFDMLNPADDKLFQNLGRTSKDVDQDLKAEIQNNRTVYKKFIENLRDKFFFATQEEMLENLRKIKSSVETLVNVIIEFSEMYTAAKKENTIIDFNDMEHFALKILSDKSTEMALRRKYQAVMVDEYQDTNGVQEAILNKIADEEKCNFFAVGDVKQSIYKFRLADPSIFMEKYNEYPKRDDCMRIDLSKNFRSRKEVLDAVNFVFERLMTSESMEIDYTDEARLYYGMNYLTNMSNMLGTPAEFYIVNDNNAKVDDEDKQDNEDDENQDTDSILGIERETQIIADKINELINSDTQIYDKETNKYRKIKYSDIVILRRSKKNPKYIMEVLQKNNIPAYSMGDETYFQKMEIQIIIALLTILDNARQDIPMAAVMLSPIGEFTAEDLAVLRIIGKKDDLFTVLMMVGTSTEIAKMMNVDEELSLKSKRFLEKLNAWRELSRVISVSELILTIYRETGYYDYVGGLPDGVLRQANLRMLVDRATAYEATLFRGLSRFLKFISKIKELKTDLSVARTLSENENVVRVMTIHKSKGLEFPVVFVIELGKRFNTAEDSSDLVLRHHKLGIGPYVTLKNEPLRFPTFARQVIAQQNIEEQKAEELRILYVAMTRAREKLILVGTKKGNDNKYLRYKRYGNIDKIPGFMALSANSFLDWLLLALSKETEHIKTIEIDAADVTIAEKSEDETVKIKPDMSKLIHKVSNLTDKSIPSKMSVTELKRRVEYDEDLTENLIDKDDIYKYYKDTSYKRPDFEQTKKLTGAEFGTLMHSVMQRLDLNGDLTAEGIKKQIDYMVEQNIFTDEQAKIIRKNKAANFFASDIGKRMIASDEVYRELPFSRLVDASRFFKNVDDKIFIQGVIDVLFKEGDKFVLIDYKTDHFDIRDNTAADKIKDKYELQIELYSEAVESILNTSITEKYLYMMNSGVLIAL